MLTNCKINNFKINAQIGSGAFGLVFHTFDTITHREYAIKAVMKKSQQSNNSDNVDPSIKKSTILETQLYHFFKTYQDTLYLPSVDLDSISNLTDKQLESIPPVSYTHLDVYKRQYCNYGRLSLFEGFPL